jgi:acyl-coenzyme A synthetase/AMP-(fatty) acid ligase
MVRAVDLAGETLPQNQVGELVISGRHVTLGYWKASDETNHRFRVNAENGKRELWTGDLGCIDDDGFVVVNGRMDSLLKHQGFRVSASEIEMEASKVPGVIESAVVSADSGELHLFVRLSTTNETTPDIRQFLRGNLEWFKIPEHVHVVDEMPRTLNGKTDRARLPAIVDSALSLS